MEGSWGVVLDVDGTMVDNHEYHFAAWVEFGRRYNCPITGESYLRYINSRTNEEIVEYLRGEYPAVRIPDAIGGEKEALYRELFFPHMIERPGLTAFVRALHDTGIPSIAASNGIRENTAMVVEGLGLHSHMLPFVCSEDVSKGKPSPDLLFLAAERLGVAIERCVVFEDSPAGFEAVRAAKAKLVMLTEDRKPELRQYGIQAALCIEDFSGLSPESVFSSCFGTRPNGKAAASKAQGYR